MEIVYNFVSTHLEKGKLCPICGQAVKRIVFRRDKFYVVHEKGKDCLVAKVTQKDLPE